MGNLEQDVRRTLMEKGPGKYVVELLPGWILDSKEIIKMPDTDLEEGNILLQGIYPGFQTKEGFAVELEHAIVFIPYEAARCASFVYGPSSASRKTKPIETYREVVVKANEVYL